MNYVIQRDELYHHGVMGMHWGIRRYQNPNGTLTAEGKARLKTDAKFKAKVNDYRRKDKLKAKGVTGLTSYLTRRNIRKGMKENDAIEQALSTKKVVNGVLDIVGIASVAALSIAVPVVANGLTAYNRMSSTMSSLKSNDLVKEKIFNDSANIKK